MKIKQLLTKTLLVAAGLLVGGANSVWAAGTVTTLTSSYAVTGYKMKAYYNIGATNVDGICPTEGDVRFRGYDSSRGGNFGLFNYGGGNRSGDIAVSVSEGDLVIFQVSGTLNSVSSCTANTTITDNTYSVWDVNSDAASLTVNLVKGSYIVAILIMEEDTNPAYAIKAVSGGTVLSTFASGNVATGSSYSTYIPHALLYGGNYYVLDDASNENLDGYYVSYTMGSSDETREINYTLNSAIVAYWECENLSYVGHSFYNTRTDLHDASKGNVVTPYSGTANGIRTNTTIGSGVYDITIKPNYWGSSSTTYTLEYSTDGDNWTTIETVSFTKDSNAEYVADDVIIPANSYLRLLSPGSTPRHSLDYIIAEKTANLPATENIIVSNKGYATYVSNYNLDFTSATTKAYKVNVASKGVATLTQVDEVPAKTPVLLYAAGGNGEGEAITISSSAMAAVTGNDLVAGTGATVPTNQTVKVGEDDVDYTNMILNKWDGIGFYFAAGQRVDANRAYLHILTSLAPDEEVGGGAPILLVFDNGNVTGIDTVQGSGLKVNGYYNLNGQRVAQPTKGLYIVNGKKVVIK